MKGKKKPTKKKERRKKENNEERLRKIKEEKEKKKRKKRKEMERFISHCDKNSSLVRAAWPGHVSAVNPHFRDFDSMTVPQDLDT